jgi:nucleoside phosphorylase
MLGVMRRHRLSALHGPGALRHPDCLVPYTSSYQPRKLTLGRLECHLFEELRLLFTVGGHGKTQLAVRTQHLIEQRADFQVLICAGAAGSLGGDLALGDVVVGLSTIEHDYKQVTIQGDISIRASFPMDNSCVERLYGTPIRGSSTDGANAIAPRS